MPRSHRLAATTYLLLALTFWLPYGPSSGMPYETAFPWDSENARFPATMLYEADPLRIFTSVFYDLGYRLSELLQIPGSYLGQQIIFLLLIWARALLLYLALAALIPQSPWLAFFSGAFALIHAADTASMWIGQMNQLGYMFWLALASYALVRATEPAAPRPYPAIALAASYLCIYSYESPIFLLGLVPIAILTAQPSRLRPNLFLFALWYLIPATYAWRYLRRTILAHGGTYQSTVMRNDFAPTKLLTEWAAQIETSLAFWKWPAHEPGLNHAAYALAAAAIFLLACAAFHRTHPFDARAHSRPARAAIAIGLVLCAFSFPAYLFLEGGGGRWRTQFLSGFGTAITLSALLLVIPKTPLLLRCLSAALVVSVGANSLTNAARSQWIMWDRHRTVIAGILAAVPNVEPRTTILLTGIPANADPFGDNLWFDYAIKLAYPRQPVAGTYFRQPNQPAPGRHPPITARTIALEQTPNGTAIQNEWPHAIPAPESVKAQYNPPALIKSGPPAPIALNRFQPIPSAKF